MKEECLLADGACTRGQASAIRMCRDGRRVRVEVAVQCLVREERPETVATSAP